MASLPPLEGFVVGTVDFAEAHRIVTVLSAPEGRLSLVVYRARSGASGWPPLLQAGNLLRIQRQRGRGELAVARSADLLNAPRRARGEVERIALLAYGCEVCAGLAPIAHPAPKLHRLLSVWLERLEAEEPPGDAVRVALEGKALTFAGVAPSLLRCARCGAPLDEPAVFDPEAGGALHARCGAGRPVSQRALAAIEALRRTPLLDIGGAALGEVPWLLADFLEHHLGRAVRSRAVLAQVLRTAG